MCFSLKPVKKVRVGYTFAKKTRKFSGGAVGGEGGQKTLFKLNMMQWIFPSYKCARGWGISGVDMFGAPAIRYFCKGSFTITGIRFLVWTILSIQQLCSIFFAKVALEKGGLNDIAKRRNATIFEQRNDYPASAGTFNLAASHSTSHKLIMHIAQETV